VKLIQAAALLILAAAPAAARKKDKAPPPAPAAAASAAAPAEKATMDDGRKRIEAYLAQRGKKLEDAYAARMAFSARENLRWEEFWGQERDVRKTFELRTARQVVDLFSTLETIDPKNHAATIADFEKLRANMVKSFEAQQKAKMEEFFSVREARYRQFAAEQEKDRSAFASDAEAAWLDDKNFLKSIQADDAGNGSAKR
jgi:hypothetical protein